VIKNRSNQARRESFLVGKPPIPRLVPAARSGQDTEIGTIPLDGREAANKPPNNERITLRGRSEQRSPSDVRPVLGGHKLTSRVPESGPKYVTRVHRSQYRWAGIRHQIN